MKEETTYTVPFGTLPLTARLPSVKEGGEADIQHDETTLKEFKEIILKRRFGIFDFLNDDFNLYIRDVILINDEKASFSIVSLDDIRLNNKGEGGGLVVIPGGDEDKRIRADVIMSRRVNIPEVKLHGDFTSLDSAYRMIYQPLVLELDRKITAVKRYLIDNCPEGKDPSDYNPYTIYTTHPSLEVTKESTVYYVYSYIYSACVLEFK